jgi:hypothetical protein
MEASRCLQQAVHSTVAVSSLLRNHNFSLSEEQASPLSQRLRYGDTGELDTGMPLKCYGPSLITSATVRISMDINGKSRSNERNSILVENRKYQ